MKLPIPLLAGLLALALGAAPARAYTYGDTLTVLMKPLPNLPTLARPGDILTVWALAPAGTTGWSASLTLAGLTIPLGAPSGGYDAALGRWVLGFAIPAGAPEELYDLHLTSDQTLPDVAQHAVKVLPDWRASYYFAQISDTHLPEHTFSSGGSINTADTSGMADFDAVIADLNLIHPEFILHTGDLVNEGELEEYLGMYEMGRAQQMITRLRDPIFVSSGNHDIGGWQPTAPPAGTSRKDWWRYFGWPWLANPPAAEPWHSQDYSFDYGLLHCIGMEAYENYPSYDYYLPALYGQQSMTSEQMSWLAGDVAAVPPGHTKLAFFHYDFGGTNPNGSRAANFTQFANLAALGLDGVIWGHNHGVAEGNRAARPFNLGLQSVIYNSVAGGRTFRIFRVVNGAVSPGPMHHAGSTTDSLAAVWSGPNDGTRSTLSATITNRFGEAWDHARLVFYMVDHDSTFGVSGGTLAQSVRQGGMVNVYVDCVIPAGTLGSPGVATVVVTANAAVAGVEDAPGRGLRLDPPAPNPLRAAGTARIRFVLPGEAETRLDVLDVAGRRVATLVAGRLPAGAHEAVWNGAGPDGAPVAAGLYFVRLRSGGRSLHAKLMRLR